MRDTLDPIDAAIGVSNGGWKEKDSGHAVAQQVDAALAYRYGRDARSVERALNEGKELAQQTHVFSARELGTGMVLVTRAETPYEARLRLQTAEGHLEPLSFHSAIPNNPEHSRRVLAYDLAIGAGTAWMMWFSISICVGWRIGGWIGRLRTKEYLVKVMRLLICRMKRCVLCTVRKNLKTAS